MAIGVVRGIEMVSKWCLIKNIQIEGEIVAFTPDRDLYMLILDEVEDGSYGHVCKPGRDMRGAWAKFDLVPVKLTEKDPDLSITFLTFWITQKCKSKQRVIHFQLLDLHIKTFICVMWCLLCKKTVKWGLWSPCVTPSSITAKYLQSVLGWRQWWWFWWWSGWCIQGYAAWRPIYVPNICCHMCIVNTCITLAGQLGRLHCFLCRCTCL